MLKDVKVLTEELRALKVEARAIHAASKNAGRQMTEEETARFDQITKTEIPEKQNELNRASEIEAQVMALSIEDDRNRRITELDAEPEFTNRQQVLPRDGVPAGDHRASADNQIYVRHSKLKVFSSDRQAFDAGMWLRAVAAKERNREDIHAMQHCKRRGMVVSNVMSEGTGAAGGYVVPAQIANEMIAFRENVGVARQVCRVMPMTADTLTIPKRAGGLTVYAPGEAAAITASDASLNQVELINKKRAVLAQLSQELSDDSLISMADFLAEEMTYALAIQEDKELINGTGAATGYFGVRGLLNRIGAGGVSTAATGHDTWPEIDIADITSAVGLLPERYDRDLSWVCSRNFYYTVMMRLMVSAGGNAVAEISAGAGGVRSFLGYPVYITSQMPTSTAAATVCALFGSFSQAAVLGDRGGIMVSRDDSLGFASDLITLKATSRYDINVHEPGTASAAGAYVALKTAS